MTYSVLSGLPLKVARAEAHIAEVESAMHAYLDGRSTDGTPYQTEGHFEPQTSEYVIRARLRFAPPPEIGVALGEAAHALRSSLDHLIWDLVYLRKNTPTRRTQFPVFLDEPGFTKTGVPMLSGTTKTDKDAIHSFQPFVANPTAPADDPLAVMSWVDNTDKHRVIHAVLPIVSAPWFPSTADADGYYESPIEYAWSDFSRNNDAGQITRIRVRRPTLSLGVPEDVIRIGLQPAGPDPMMTLASAAPGLLFGERSIYLGQLNAAKGIVQQIFNRFRPEFDA